MDFISGEWFFSLCDVIILTRSHIEYHAKTTNLKIPVLFLEDDWNSQNNTGILEYKVVGVYSQFFENNLSKFSSLKCATTYVVHNSDAIYDSNKIFSWLDNNPSITLYAQNLTFEHSRAFVLPIGQANTMWAHGNKTPWNHKVPEKTINILKTYFTNTHSSRNIQNNQAFTDLECVNYSDYVVKLKESRFVLCPPGNGPDTHRLWETLNANATPIVLEDSFIKQLVRTCPDLPLVKIGNFNTYENYSNLTYQSHNTFYTKRNYWLSRILGTPIVFIHMGDVELPEHTYDAILQARLWNQHNPIFLISKSYNPIFQCKNFYHINIENINKTPEWELFNNNTNLDSNFRGNFWRYTAERILVLHAFVKQYGIEKCYHLENDNLLYCNINEEFKEYKNYPLVATRIGENDQRILLNSLLCNDTNILGEFCHYLATNRYENEMKGAYQYYKLNPEKMHIFPHNPNRENSLIMDAAPIGQYLGGPDPRNINKPENSVNPGFCNEGLDFDIKQCKFEWKEMDHKKYLTVNDKKVGNLHIHCKNLKYFMQSKSIEDFIENHLCKFFPKSKTKSEDKTLCNVNGVLTPGLISEKGVYTHINYYTVKKALEVLIEKNPDKKYFTFLESGCSGFGAKSTLVWDSFVNYFDGKVLSVDGNIYVARETNKLLSNKSKVICNDPLKYLPTFNEPIDFLFLDSYDVDYMDSADSASHHLKEFNCIKHLLHENSVVLIDDTPVSPEWIDEGIYNSSYEKIKEIYDPNIFGKGGLVNIELEYMGASKILHQYQSLWIINKLYENFISINSDEVNIQYDCVIPYGPNDQGIVNLTIENARKNLINLRNIYIVSYDKNFSHPLAITIDEKIYPFNVENIKEILYENRYTNRYKWYLQQLLKLYAYKMIPNLSEHFLILDSDTLFLKPTRMLEGNIPLYNTNDEYHPPYFKHMNKLHHKFKKIHTESAICHHMMFKKEYLENMMEIIEKIHKKDFWRAFLECVDDFNTGSGASEYETYFAYLHIYQKNNIKIRKLNNRNLCNINQITPDLDYASIHHWMRR